MVSVAQQIEQLPSGGLLYEPRSMWSVLPLRMESFDQEFSLPNIHFYNGGKYPITLKRVAIHGINYDLRRALQSAGKYSSSATVQNWVQLAIGVPFRQHYGREPILTNALTPMPTGQPQMRGPVEFGVDQDYLPSSIWGQSVMTMDHPLYLPQRASIECSFGSIRRPLYEVGPGPRGYAVWQEEGGLFAGSGRSFEWDIQSLTPTVNDLQAPLQTVPPEGWPYALTSTQFGYGGLPDTTQYWDPSAHFSSKAFDAQESTRGGTSKITQFRAMLDQRQTDEGVATAFPGEVPEMASLAGRIGTRIRTTNGGTKEWWWRPGAPMSLVMDTITPATVFELPIPITLSTEDSLDIRVIVPGIPGLPAAENLRIMNVGVSLNGFASIEG